jgi:hypothetical protein
MPTIHTDRSVRFGSVGNGDPVLATILRMAP